MFEKDGVLHAETPEELRQLMQYAASGNAPRSGPANDIALDAGLAFASSFLPGAQTDFAVTGVGVPDGPARTPLGYGTNGFGTAAKTKATGFLSNMNNLRKGYEAGIQPLVDAQTKAISGLLPQGPLPAKGGHLMKVGRFAGNALKNPYLQTGLKYAPLVGTALSVGDLVLGNESAANKTMDAALMTAGGFLGSAVPVVGTALGVTGGKMVSDGLQYLFGDKMTPEQREMAAALAALKGGMV